MAADTDARPAQTRERREAPDRRRRLLHALFIGSITQRRRDHRRAAGSHPHPLDFHDARWLAVAIAILLLSVFDAFLTLRLLELGAVEVNPLMAMLLDGTSAGFAFWKVGLTAAGVVILTVMARLHVFGRLPVSAMLYLVLGLYAGLIGYEYWLLRALQAG
jgi:hypothetical protein